VEGRTRQTLGRGGRVATARFAPCRTNRSASLSHFVEAHAFALLVSPRRVRSLNFISETRPRNHLRHTHGIGGREVLLIGGRLAFRMPTCSLRQAISSSRAWESSSSRPSASASWLRASTARAKPATLNKKDERDCLIAQRKPDLEVDQSLAEWS